MIFSAYELYADPQSHLPDEKITQVGSSQKQYENPTRTSMSERFKKVFSYKDVTVHFVGAWYVLNLLFCTSYADEVPPRDTVSSIGIMRGKCMLPGTVEGMKHVCYFRHALALDERRVKFLPEYAYGGTSLPPSSVLTEKAVVPLPSPLGGLFLRLGSWLAWLLRLSLWLPWLFLRLGLWLAWLFLPLGSWLACEAKNEHSEDILPTDNEAKDDQASTPHTMEVWFAGTHSDM
jgi:hypothetical protein